MTDLPEPSLRALYGHSMVSGSAERQAAAEAASAMAATVWISLDPLASESEPPEGVVWLRLGEPGLDGHGWRNVLSRVSKLMPALQALGVTDVRPLSEAARPTARIAASLLRLSCPMGKPVAGLNWLRRLPEWALWIISPGRARRFASQRADRDRQLAAFVDHDYYFSQACPAAGRIDPASHYLAAGQYAGLDPHPLFWTRWYARHMLPGTADVTPWRHFIEIGRHDWANPNPFLVVRWYDRQPGAGCHHFNPLLDLEEHARRGTPAPDPNPLFDQAWYRQTYDCGKRPPLLHFVLDGARHPTCPFLAHHPELGADGQPDGYTSSFTHAFSGYPSRYPEPCPAPRATEDLPAQGRIAVCCVLTGDYDELRPIGQPDLNTDYFLITDKPPIRPLAGWRLIVAPTEGLAELKLSRAIKMNLTRYLPAGEAPGVIVYIDGNIELAGDLKPLINEFWRSGADLGVVPHPYRQCAYEEAAAVLLQLRDSREHVLETIAFLEAQGYLPRSGLFEMNFFCFRPGPAATGFFSHWWEMYRRHGDRDQLLAPLAAQQQGLALHPLLAPGQSVRSHPAFRYHPHRS